MTQRSNRGANGPWRVVAAEAAATAAASGRSIRNGGARVTTTSPPITNGGGYSGSGLGGSYIDESRLSGKHGTSLFPSSLSRVAIKPSSSTTTSSSSCLPSSSANVISTISSQRHHQQQQQQYQQQYQQQQQRSTPTTPASLLTTTNTTSSLTSMYHHHRDNHYSYNNTGYSSNNGSISKSAMTAAAAAALASTSAPSSTTGNGTIIDTSDEEEEEDGEEEEDDDYSTPIRRSANYKNNIITASSGGGGGSSSSSKLREGSGDGPSSSPSSATAAAAAAKLDRYGFYVNDPQSKGLSDDLNNLSLVEMTRKRESKWLHMFTNWDDYIHKKWKKLRARCRKGIPDSVRGKAWFYLCAGHKQKQRNPELFAKLDGQPGDEKINDEIRKDLNRQFPSHEMFAQENGSGQEDLYRILKAFSVIKPDIGYCQGQAPLASVLLMQMPAEDAFWCLLQICDHYVPGYFSPGLEAIQLHGQMLSSFVKKFHQPIYKLFKKQKIDPVLYMTEWFMCFFSRTLSWPCVLRVWDMFFCEGIVVIFKVALILISSVLGRHEDRVKCVSAYETLFALKNIPSKFVTEEFLIEKVINMDLSEKDLQKEHKEQSLKRKKEKERLNHERSKSTSSISRAGGSGNVGGGGGFSTINSTNSKGSIRNRSRSKSDF